MRFISNGAAVTGMFLGCVVASDVSGAVISTFRIDNSACTSAQQVTPTRCEQTDATSGDVVTTTLETREDLGDFGLRGSVSAVDDNDSFGTAFTKEATVGVNFADTLSFGIESGTLLIPIDVDATLTALEAGSNGTGSGSDVVAFFSVVANATTVYDRFLDARTSEGGIFSDEETGSLGVTEFALPFTGGTADFDLSINARLQCSSVLDTGEFCTAAVDAFNSVKLFGATLLDETGATVIDPTISSASGFDYAAGIVVPLPATGALLLGGLAGLCWLGSGQVMAGRHPVRPGASNASVTRKLS